MKLLHKENLFCWTQFDQERNIDFHSYLWVRKEGNVVFDPLPLTAHDEEHLKLLGGVSFIIISNSDHVRNADVLAEKTGAEIWGPAGEEHNFPIKCSKWLSEGDSAIDELAVYSVDGSKTKGELAFVVEGDTLVTGDLIRAHSGGKLCMLPNAKLSNIEKAKRSVARLAAISGVSAILPGDGWPVFRDGERVLSELENSLS